MSGRKFSAEFGISPALLSKIENDKAEPGKPLVRLIEVTYGVSFAGEEVEVYTTSYKGPERRKNFELRGIIDKAVAVLQSDYSLVKEALERNILAFHQALEDHREKTE